MNRLIIMLALFLLSACSGKKDNAEMMKTLRSELKQTDSLFVILKQNPADSILHLMDSSLERVKSILTDTMSNETEKILEDYLELQSSLKDYKTGRDTIAREIVYSKTQVENLDHDVANNSGSGSEFEVHSKKEFEAIKMLQRNITKMDNWYDSASKTFITANELLQQRITIDSTLNTH